VISNRGSDAAATGDEEDQGDDRQDDEDQDQDSHVSVIPPR
jgi:hypothetical protein